MAIAPPAAVLVQLPHDIPLLAATIVRTKATLVPTLEVAAFPRKNRKQLENMEGLLRTIWEMALQCDKGQRATKRWEVIVYHMQRVAAVVLAALGAAGLVILRLDQGQLQGASLAVFLGGLIALGVNIAAELYTKFGVEKKALQAMAARGAYTRLKNEVEIALRQPNPIPKLTALQAEADGLSRTFLEVLGAEDSSNVQLLFLDWVARYDGHWHLLDKIQERQP